MRCEKVPGIRSMWSSFMQVCWLTQKSEEVDICGRWSTVNIGNGCISLMSFFILKVRPWKVIYVTLGYLLRVCSNRNRGLFRDRDVASRLWQICIVAISPSSLSFRGETFLVVVGVRVLNETLFWRALQVSLFFSAASTASYKGKVPPLFFGFFGVVFVLCSTSLF